MPTLTMASSWYPWLKLTVFALLACNAAVFSLAGTFTEALDAGAWLTLLALFELETGSGDRIRGRRAAAIVHGARLIAAAAVVGAALGYVFENGWLDAVNSALWIAVVVLLELEVRYPGTVKRHRSAFAASAAGALFCIKALRSFPLKLSLLFVPRSVGVISSPS